MRICAPNRNLHMNIMENQPSLVEPSVKYFLSDALKKTHEYKMKTYSFILNLAIGVVFFIVFGGFLYYRYKSKPTPEEKQIFFLI